MIDEKRISNVVRRIFADKELVPGVLSPVLRYHNVSNNRFYRILVGRNLFNDLVLVREWGSLRTNAGDSKETPYSQHEIEKLINKIFQTVQARFLHGYDEVSAT
jgi:hypothetical protein